MIGNILKRLNDSIDIFFSVIEYMMLKLNEKVL